MSTSERLDRAFEILRRRGHRVDANPGAFIGPDGQLLVTIDGQLRTATEIYGMTDETVHGSAVVTHEPGEERYAISFVPHDYGRGALGQRYVTEAGLMKFFDEMRLLENAKSEALQRLGAQHSCEIADLHVSHAYLQRMKLVD